MQMLRRIVVIVSVVVTASVAVGPSISTPAAGHEREEVRRHHHPCHRRDRQRDEERVGHTGLGGRDLGSQTRHVGQGLRHR